MFNIQLIAFNKVVVVVVQSLLMHFAYFHSLLSADSLSGMDNYGRNMFNSKRSRVHYEGRSVFARNKYTGIQLSV